MNSETKNTSTDSVRVCQNCKENFTIEQEDFDFYKKMNVPPPTWCPECRLKRRCMFWCQRNLFKKRDALTGEELFSTFSEKSPAKICKNEYWWSDKFDASEYAKDYDFSKPFFEQFKELYFSVPQAARSIQDLVNSDYSNLASYLKNCYLCFNGGEGENSMYSISFVNIKDSLDLFSTQKCELSYELFSVTSAYQVFFSVESGQCLNVWFSKNCDNCKDCFGCVNLRNKQYHIFNNPYTKEEYQKKIKEFNLGSYKSLEEMKRTVSSFWLGFPMKYMNGSHNSNISGDYIYRSKNAKYCFEVTDVEDSKFIQNVSRGIRDSYDYTNWGENSESFYEVTSAGYDCKNLKFCFDNWPNCQNLEYSAANRSCQNLFGCVGLKKKSFCILNKEYGEEDFYKLREKIIAQMNKMPYIDGMGRVYKYGEFFPLEISPCSYNESAAIDYFPISKEEALKKGYQWRDIDKKEFAITISADQLPDHINDVDDNIVKEIIGCSSCKKAFRIIKDELAFYKRFNLPLPRKCHLCRYEDRIKLRNTIKYYARKCSCAGIKSDNGIYTNTASHFSAEGGSSSGGHSESPCPNEFETSYSPERPEIVYCEECYQQEVV